ncbi:MAG: hypothetical protein IPN34_09340 [Planctomycetes bacterium]|nr:hypothetical protein [Planctomycetota bacterium]
MSFRDRRNAPFLRAVALSSGIALGAASCTSLTIEPRNAHEGVVIGYAWSFNIITVTIPLSPRERALDLVGSARLSDVRNAEIEEWPNFIWPINWLNGLIGYCGAEVRAEYGLPPPGEPSSADPSATPPAFPSPSADEPSANEEKENVGGSGAP